MDRGEWQATVHRVTKSQTRLKRFSKHGEELTVLLPIRSSMESRKRAWMTFPAGQQWRHRHRGQQQQSDIDRKQKGTCFRKPVILCFFRTKQCLYSYGAYILA